MAQLESANITIPNEIINDCDPGDKQYITNATALQRESPPAGGGGRDPAD
jgi:tartrate-resistant acid phosphatase type 5